jgi:hypothetical protein
MQLAAALLSHSAGQVSLAHARRSMQEHCRRRRNAKVRQQGRASQRQDDQPRQLRLDSGAADKRIKSEGLSGRKGSA